MNHAFRRAVLWTALAGVWTLAGAARLPEGIAMYWDADRPAPGWRDSAWQQGGTGRIRHDLSVKKHGVASIRLEGVPGEATAFGNGVQPAVVDGGESYVLRFWSRRTGTAAAVAQVRLFAAAHEFERRCRPIGWAELAGGRTALRIPPSVEWSLVEAPLGPLPGGTDRLLVTFSVTGATTLWIDEVSLARTGVAVPLGGRAPLTDADYAGIRFSDASLPANILRNGGFEEAGLGPWRMQDGGSKGQIEAEKGHTGLRSFRFDAKEFSSTWIWQRTRVDPRRRYRLSLHASCTGLVGYLFTKILPFNRHGQPTGWTGKEILVTGTTAGWLERAIEFSVPPATENVVIYVRVEDTIGRVWVDDVALRPLPLDVAERK